MNRRDFLRRAAIVAAGAVAADQLELLERLTHRKVWAGADFEPMTAPAVAAADDDYIVYASVLDSRGRRLRDPVPVRGVMTSGIITVDPGAIDLSSLPGGHYILNFSTAPVPSIHPSSIRVQT